MPSEYTSEELANMSAMELVAAQQRGFKRPAQPESINALKAEDPPPRDSNAWERNRDSMDGDGEEFTAPSGQTCRLRRVTPEMLLPLGILDRVTRLEGLAQSLIDVAEGAPPQQNTGPSREDLELLLETVDLLVPIAVVVPKVYANDDQTAPAGAIRVGHIDLDDRVAIMEHVLRGIKSMDRFRHAG